MRQSTLCAPVANEAAVGHIKGKNQEALGRQCYLLLVFGGFQSFQRFKVSGS
jgi:hypothetical protein